MYKCKSCGGLVQSSMITYNPPTVEYKCTICNKAKYKKIMDEHLIEVNFDTD